MGMLSGFLVFSVIGFVAIWFWFSSKPGPLRASEWAIRSFQIFSFFQYCRTQEPIPLFRYNGLLKIKEKKKRHNVATRVIKLDHQTLRDIRKKPKKSFRKDLSSSLPTIVSTLKRPQKNITRKILKKKKTATTEDQGSFLYLDMEGKRGLFDEIDYEVSSILLELSHPVVFSSDPPLFHQWGRTKKRSCTVLLRPPKISPPCAEVAEMGSTSCSSCLTGDAKKTNPQSIKKGFEVELTNGTPKVKITSQTKASSCSVLESETSLIRAQVGLLLAQPIGENLRDLQPLIYAGNPTVNKRDHLERRGFDLNLPAEAEGNLIATTTMVVDFQSVATKAQAAAQARQRRLGLIRSKKRFSRFLSSYKFK